jgi:hypothetical protein
MAEMAASGGALSTAITVKRVFVLNGSPRVALQSDEEMARVTLAT